MASISQTDIKTFRAIIALSQVRDGLLRTLGDDTILEPIMIDLLSKGLVRAQGIYYKPTAEGNLVFENFMKRYTEYLKLYDVFAFIDLDKAEFAFSKYFDFQTDQDWDNFKTNPRFEDLRLAVAIFKKLNPAEIVFMSFINENRFDTKSTGWQVDLMSDQIWQEIETICETALKPEQLGTAAMEDIISQGSQIVVDLIKTEEARKIEEIKNSPVNPSCEVVEEEIIEEESVYYESYYDPYYISPFWLVPLILW